MGVASLVLGIVAAVFAWIPFCGTWALVPAIVGLVLGIIDWVKKKKADQPKGKAIAGTVCSGVALIIIAIWWALVGAAAHKVAKEIENFDYNSVDWNSLAEEWNDISWDDIDWDE